MNQETFIVLMEQEGWKLTEPIDMSTAMTPSDQPPIKMKQPDFVFQREIFLIHLYDNEVGLLPEDGFDNWFISRVSCYHFFDDWKKKFKGSEFLIPVVEKEFEQRKYGLMNNFYGKLIMIQHGHSSFADVINFYDKELIRFSIKLRMDIDGNGNALNDEQKLIGEEITDASITLRKIPKSDYDTIKASFVKELRTKYNLNGAEAVLLLQNIFNPEMQ